MQTGVAGGIIDENTSIIILNPTIGKTYIHHITNVLLALRSKEVTTWLGYDASGIIEGCHIHI